MDRERALPDPHKKSLDFSTLLENDGRSVSEALEAWKRQVKRAVDRTPPISQFYVACPTPTFEKLIKPLIAELGGNSENISYVNFAEPTFRPIDAVEDKIKSLGDASHPVIILQGFTKSFDHTTKQGGKLSQPLGHVWNQSIRDGLAKLEPQSLQQKGGLIVITHIDPMGDKTLFTRAAQDALSSHMKDGMIWLSE